MSITEAINILIERNQSLVNKSGISDYTTLSDKIINTLLQYYHNTQEEIARLKNENEKAGILLKLHGLENYLNMDADFLERYLHYDFIVCDSQIENMQDIKRSYEHYRIEFIFEFEQYLFIKNMYPTLKERLRKINPDYYRYVEKQYNDNEVKKLIKQNLLYQYE